MCRRLLLLTASLLFGPVFCGAATAPKLVLAIVVDQLRYDYLERFHDHFTTNGFRLLTDDGAFLTFANYDYFPTVTAPGHASVFSGAPPSVHGVIGNDWFDKRTGKNVYCVADPSVNGVGTATNKSRMSPRNFIGGSFADEFRLRFRSKVIGISMKDRGAILPAGKKPTGAFWFEASNGNFVTSSYYMSELPGWVQDFNARKRTACFAGAEWTRLLDESSYLFDDQTLGEGNLHGETNAVFNHKLTYKTNSFDEIAPTPFANQLLAELAEAAIEGEKLGQGANPDLLCVSFSAVDAVGHRFGPYSHEVQDIMFRLDRQIAGLLSFVDARIGLENVVIMLTADHGVAPTPEFAAKQGFESRRLDGKAFAESLAKKLNDEFGTGSYLQTTNLINGHLFLKHATLREKRIETEVLLRFVREFALETGDFQACYTRDQLLDGRAPGWVGELVVQGYHAERGGDMVLVPKPFIVPGTGKTGTTHGSPYSYDTQVPVLLRGPGFTPGRYPHEFYISDIVPTLCAALRMSCPPGSTGRPFIPVLASP